MSARPCHPDWVRAVRDLCLREAVPFFFKHWGHKGNNPAPDQELDWQAKGGATLDKQLWRKFPQ